MNVELQSSSVALAPPPDGRISYEEFLALDGEDWAEWVDGEIIKMSPPIEPHQDLTGFLFTILRVFVQQNKLGKVIIAPFQMRLEMRPSGREPDLLFIKSENLARLNPKYLDGPADLVVEVISPESRARDRGEKFYEYEQAGVPEYWILDQARRKAEFYALGADGLYEAAAVGAGGVYRSALLPGFWLRLAWLWQEPTCLRCYKNGVCCNFVRSRLSIA
jgi:Uma2 family endonuclease